uniref:Tripartite motif-containing protein 5 n=1 Tax=Cebus imitator TaxID=2715852 RepID=A0A2K5REY8_CEBIM
MQCSTSELTCSICTDYFTDPIAICCGHRVCSPCLCLLWEDAQTPTCCPVCREVSQQMNFKHITFVKKQVFRTRESVTCHVSSSAMLICRRHQETKNFTCETDRRHYRIKADEYYRENFLMQMKNLNRETNIIQKWKVFIHLQVMMISAEYPKVRQYLRAEKQKHLESLASEGKMIFLQLRRSETRMAKTGRLLRGMDEKLKEICWKADMADMNLIQVKTEEGVSALAMPQPVNPQFSAWTITGMSERLNFFRGKSMSHRKKCSNHKLLFKDLRCLQCSLDDTDMSCNPTNTEYTSSWGAQILSSGKHYWAVDLKDSCNWVIGLCREAWTKRNDMQLESESIVQLLCLKVDDHFSLFSTSSLLHHYIPRPQGWLGVFLDYECGIVSYINIAQSFLICSFISHIFYFPLRPFI